MRDQAAWLVRRLLPQVNRHLSDKQFADLFCRELAFRDRCIARRHLARCADCRMRREQLEGARAAHMLHLHRMHIGNIDLELPPQPRVEFASWLDRQTWGTAVGDTYSGKVAAAFSFPWFRYEMLAVSGALAFGLAVFAASLWWQHVPRLSTNAFLAHAEMGESVDVSATPGVVHQRVVIRTRKERIERSISWDRQGKLRPRRVRLDRSEEHLRSELDGAGVDWYRPVSAAAYQTWHDHLHVREDRITHSGMHLLTLTTTVPDGLVSSESLTVRDSDFHPVKRTVDFREIGTVEIAEVDFNVLPWSPAEAGAFEPPVDAPQPLLPASSSMPRSLPSAVRGLEATTPAQFDETELAARLILNQLHADNGEQIEISRSPQGIEVNGLVQTDERKRELRAQLITVPRLKVSIDSIADLSRDPASAKQSISIESAALPDNASALGAYLAPRGRSVDEISAVAQHIFSNAMTISLESRSILELKTRFHATKDMPIVASATLSELLYSHHEHLEAALRYEQLLLAQIATDTALNADSSCTAARSLPVSKNEAAIAEAAAKNLALAKELTETSTPRVREAKAIFADISATIARLAVAERDEYATAEEKLTLDVKPGEER